jgi:hypothetical protein
VFGISEELAATARMMGMLHEAVISPSLRCLSNYLPRELTLMTTGGTTGAIVTTIGAAVGIRAASVVFIEAIVCVSFTEIVPVPVH